MTKIVYLDDYRRQKKLEELITQHASQRDRLRFRMKPQRIVEKKLSPSKKHPKKQSLEDFFDTDLF